MTWVGLIQGTAIVHWIDSNKLVNGDLVPHHRGLRWRVKHPESNTGSNRMGQLSTQPHGSKIVWKKSLITEWSVGLWITLGHQEVLISLPWTTGSVVQLCKRFALLNLLLLRSLQWLWKSLLFPCSLQKSESVSATWENTPGPVYLSMEPVSSHS